MQSSERDVIVIIIANLGIGGAERVVVDEVNELYRRGLPVTLITLKPEGLNSYMQQCELPNEHRICIGPVWLLDIRGWARLIFALSKLRPKAVVTHLWYANTIGRIAGTIARVPCIITFEHNIYDTVKTRKQFFVDRMLQVLSTRIVMATNAIRVSLITHGISPKRLVVFPNGVDPERYRNVAARSFQPGSNTDFVFFFAGRLIKQKGVDILISAFAMLERGVLIIAGSGESRVILETQARALGISDRVHFLGLRGDIPALMKAADCFVMPSRHEGMPIVLIEALTIALPIIVSDFSSARQIVHDGSSAIIVPIEDSNTLSQAMQRIMEDQPLRDTLRQGAAKEAARFSIRTHIDSLLSCIESHR